MVCDYFSLGIILRLTKNIGLCDNSNHKTSCRWSYREDKRMIKMQTNEQRAAGYRELEAEYRADGKAVLADKAAKRAAQFDDTNYNAWRDAIHAKYRAEYRPYDKFMEFEVGFAAGLLGIYDLGWTGLEAQAFDRGLECFHRLARVFQNT
jgi:hypothetical protein